MATTCPHRARHRRGLEAAIPLLYHAKGPVLAVLKVSLSSPCDGASSLQTPSALVCMGECFTKYALHQDRRCRPANVSSSERVHDAITGHAPKSVGRTYGKATPEDMAATLRKFPRYEI